MFKALAISSVLIITACSTTAPVQKTKGVSEKRSYKKNMWRLERTLNKQAKIVSQLRDENQRLRMAKGSSIRSSSLLNQVDTNAARDLGENKLFSAFISANNSGRTKKARRAFYLLEKTYPSSPLLAEALFLQAKKDLEKKSYKSALKKMNRLIEEFPKHPRLRSAMLGKSVIYRRLNLIKPAQSILKELIAKYPKTVEAKKAGSHLALMNSNLSKEP